MILLDITNWKTLTACLLCLATGVYIGIQVEKGNKIKFI